MHVSNPVQKYHPIYRSHCLDCEVGSAAANAISRTGDSLEVRNAKEAVRFGEPYAQSLGVSETKNR